MFAPLLLVLAHTAAASKFEEFGGQHGNHSFLFISGMPQSGTSLLLDLAGGATTLISTMVKKCDELHGKSCTNWNHEGQWLLPRTPSISKGFKPGKMCSIVQAESESSSLAEEVMGTWMKYWDPRAQILVEKSPQSMLKMPLYKSLVDKGGFLGEAKMKFLVALKHPITLNTAIKGDDGVDPNWLTHAKTSGIISSRDRISRKREVHSEETVLSNIWHFVQFMEGEPGMNRSDNCGHGGDKQGWLNSVGSLVGELTTFAAANVGIFRYEYFLQPPAACQSIFRFIIFDSPEDYTASASSKRGKWHVYKDTIGQACRGSMQNPMYSGDLPPFEWKDNPRGASAGVRSEQHRKLRLREAPSVPFDGITRLESALKGKGKESVAETLKKRAVGRMEPGKGSEAKTKEAKGVRFAPRLVHRSINARLKEFSALIEPSHYAKVVRSVHTKRARGVGAEVRGRPRSFRDAQEEIKAIEMALGAIQDRLRPLGYSLYEPHFVRSPHSLARAHSSSVVGRLDGTRDLLLPWDVLSIYGNKHHLD